MWSLICLCTKVHVHKQNHLRNARHLRWGKLFAHTLLKCWLDTLMSSSFPLCNSSSYQPFTSDFCPAGTCTSSVSGCTPPYVSISPTHISSPFLGGEHFVPLHNLSFAYKRRSLWVLVPCSTYSRHSNSKRMRMSRSLWCLQDWVEQAASYTKQFLCTLLADGEQATSQCKTTSAKTKRPPGNTMFLCQWMLL